MQAPEADGAVLAELESLKLRQLTTRAEELGVDDDKLDDAEGKTEVIELILARLAEKAAEDSGRLEELKKELEGMKLRALTKKATEMGVDEDKLDDAEEKSDVIALILEAAM